MFGLLFSSKLDWGSYIIFVCRTVSKKIRSLICSIKFLFSEDALFLYKSTIQPYLEYCCHVWAGAPSCFLEMLVKLQKRICRTVGWSFASSSWPLGHRLNAASLILSIGIILVDIYLNWLNLFHFLILARGLLVILDCLIFSVTISRCYKDVYVNSFFSLHSYILEFSVYIVLSFNLWSKWL